MKHMKPFTGIERLALALALFVLPIATHAIDAPPLDDSPFFGWLAVPVVGIVGQKLLKKKDSDNDRRG